MKKIAILGTAGVPANYGGFETLVDNLVRYANKNLLPYNIIVCCSEKYYEEKIDYYMGAKLYYLNLNPNGISSVLYDIKSIFFSIRSGCDVILLLGVSGAIFLPLAIFFSKAKFITNIDGIEWRRNKWGKLAKIFLKFSEFIAVKFSHVIISDNKGIADYVFLKYGVESNVIAYGGDHAISASLSDCNNLNVPDVYALSICRIEPENNIEMILEAFKNHKKLSLVMIGNWSASNYGKLLYEKFSKINNIFLLGSIYDYGTLKTLRQKASCYVHGHSAGGTNPSLVEMMHFGKLIYAFDCVFNRYTTNDKAIFFKNSDNLCDLINNMTDDVACCVGTDMRVLANKLYTWDIVAKEYFDLFN